MPRLSLPVSVLLVTALSPAASAFLAHPCSHRVVVDEGRYVLVFVSPLSVAEDTGNGAPAAKVQEILEIRRTYTQSGLYRNDGSTTPLWTMPYYDPFSEFLLAPDGKHLVVQSLQCPQYLAFYDNGALVRHTDPAMIDPYLRLRLALRMNVLAVGTGRLDPETRRFIVPSSDGQMVFDITTGKLVSSRYRFTVFLGAALAALVVSVAVIYFLDVRDDRG